MSALDTSAPLWRLPWGHLTACLLAAALSNGCNDGPAAPSVTTVGHEGSWVGTTDRGDAITFEVSPGQTVTSLVFGYTLNGCRGTVRLTGVNLQVTSFVGVRGRVEPGFGYTSGPFTEPNYVQAMGSFTGPTSALGSLVFGEFQGCGNGVSNWAATKR